MKTPIHPLAARVAAAVVLCLPALAADAGGGRPARLQLGEPATSGASAVTLEGGVPFAQGLLLVGTHTRAVAARPGAVRPSVEADELVPFRLDAAGGWRGLLARPAFGLRLAQAWLPALEDGAPGFTNVVSLGAEPAPGPTLQTGEVVITEFMKDPSFVSDTRGEWIELYNNMPWRVNVEGWVLRDDAGTTVVLDNGGGKIRWLNGGYYVIGRDDDPTQNGGVDVGFAYSSFTLGNGADQIYLHKADGTLVDAVSYDDGVAWPDSAGMSISLDPGSLDAVLNDDPTRWCHAATAIGGGNTDTGTPGAANDLCP